ncbi:glycosyl hydrolase [Lacrimispora sp.]|uniref:glycosyl hydrolase n=1 Tax=Lacrimispora sp. TaxID=2719234 RepID=UPI00289EDDB3|nr:glycosyl hydrolase [Lacrimispora sp.]
MEFLEAFQNPPAEYRVKPFWFWNGEITKEEVARQIREMSEKGLGGVFICARQGMTLPYLSKEWFDMVDYACEEAKRYGLEAWLYDEYPYPSGMSGGEVLLEHPEAEHMVLRHRTICTNGERTIEEELGWSRILHASAYPVLENGGTDWNRSLDLRNCVGNLQAEKIFQETGLTKYNNKRFFSYGPKKILKTFLPAGNWQIEIYTEEAMGDFKYYGGFFDPCNPQAVKTFLETTHERYERASGSRFGAGIRGMFSDEVGMLGLVPWSKLLPGEFEKKKHYSILSVLPALHNDSFPGAVRIRYDLYETIHKMFVESYHKQVSNWCSSHKLLYATEVPSMRMGTQRYSDIIGGDTAHEKLGKPLEWIYDEYISNYRSNAKAVSSLARQLDKKYAMIESFHSVGWTMTIQDAKWMIDRLGSSGINFYNFHAFYYTIEDITKHDAPPSQFLQNPYWKYYRTLADYTGRMGMLVSNTEADIHIAVLDPVSALWTKLGNPFHGFQYGGESDKERAECGRIREGWVSLCKTLLFHQLDYDHLDAEILKEASVEDGRICIGRAAYSVVILPGCHCMEKEARDLLTEFIRQKGCVIAAGELPSLSIDWEEEDSVSERQWHQLFESGDTYILPEEEKEEALIRLCRSHIKETVMTQVVNGKSKDLVGCTRLDREGNVFVFAANQGRDPMKICLRPSADASKAEIWNMEDGIVALTKISDGSVYLSLEGFESRWVKITMGNKTENKAEEIARETITIPMAGTWDIMPEGMNLCRFANVSMSLDHQLWEQTEGMTFIEQCSRTGLLTGKEIVFTGTFGTPKKIRPTYPLTCWYRTVFTIQNLPDELLLLMDRETAAGEHEIRVNGMILEKHTFTPVRVNDQNNRAADIRSLIRMGENEIEIRIHIKKDEDGLRDSFYLWGDFGILENEGTPVLVTRPGQGEPDRNWCQGFPYYSGTMHYEKAFDLAELAGACSLDHTDLIPVRLGFKTPVYDCVEVSVNETSLGVKAYTPYVWLCDRKYLKEKNNRIRVSVTNTLANMLDGTYFDYENHSLVSIKP